MFQQLHLMSEISINGQEKRANSIAFNNDGTRMVVAGVGNDSQVQIHEYSLRYRI